MSIKKILICDDKENIRESIKLILSHSPDLITIDVDNGEKALKALTEDPKINLVLLDLNLPDIYGLDLTAIIKKRYPNIKIIIITAYDDEKTKMEALNLGASGYVIKPFALSKFLKAIEEALI